MCKITKTDTTESSVSYTAFQTRCLHYPECILASARHHWRHFILQKARCYFFTHAVSLPWTCKHTTKRTNWWSYPLQDTYLINHQRHFVSSLKVHSLYSGMQNYSSKSTNMFKEWISLSSSFFCMIHGFFLLLDYISFTRKKKGVRKVQQHRYLNPPTHHKQLQQNVSCFSKKAPV